MRNYKRLLIFIIFIILAGFAGSIIVVQNFPDGEADMTVLNDIVQTAKGNMDDISRMREFDFGVDYVIFNESGRAIFASKETGMELKYADAVRNRHTVMTITEDKEFYGNVAILENQQMIQKRQQRLSFGMLLFSGLCLIACAVLWGIYVEKIS